MKTLFTSAVILLIMAGCSKEERNSVTIRNNTPDTLTVFISGSSKNAYLLPLEQRELVTPQPITGHNYTAHNEAGRARTGVINTVTIIEP
jgi:hypothetical protein